MSDDPRLRMFLDVWERDVSEGKTVRALHERIDKHEREDDSRFETLHGTATRFAERIASIEANDKRDAEGRVASASGKWGALPDNCPVFPHLPEPPRRNSMRVVLSKAFDNAFVKAVLLLAAGTAGALLRHCTG